LEAAVLPPPTAKGPAPALVARRAQWEWWMRGRGRCVFGSQEAQPLRSINAARELESLENAAQK
jgi:hypothetical protein